jgi:hypothetical protein
VHHHTAIMKVSKIQSVFVSFVPFHIVTPLPDIATYIIVALLVFLGFITLLYVCLVFKWVTICIRFDVFPASECNEVFSGYQPGEVVQFSRDQRFEDHLCPRPQDRRNNLG